MRILEVTTAKNCSVNCYPFCPQLKFREAYGDAGDFLSFEDFSMALSHTPKDVQITFGGFSEPFLNRRALDMIELAKKEGHRVVLFSTLTGLRREDVARLKEVDYFGLHLPDDRGIAKIPVTENYKETLMEVLKELRIDAYFRMDEGFESNERAGNCDGAPVRHVRGPFYCGALVQPAFVMLPSCDVILCCMDWQLKHRLGSLLETTYDEMTQGEEFRRIAANRWRWDGDTLCRGCKFPISLQRRAVLRVYQVGRDWIRHSG